MSAGVDEHAALAGCIAGVLVVVEAVNHWLQENVRPAASVDGWKIDGAKVKDCAFRPPCTMGRIGNEMEKSPKMSVEVSRQSVSC